MQVQHGSTAFTFTHSVCAVRAGCDLLAAGVCAAVAMSAAAAAVLLDSRLVQHSQSEEVTCRGSVEKAEEEKHGWVGVAVQGCGLHQGSTVTEQMSGCPARSAAPGCCCRAGAPARAAVLAGSWHVEAGGSCCCAGRLVACGCRWRLLLCWHGRGLWMQVAAAAAAVLAGSWPMMQVSADSSAAVVTAVTHCLEYKAGSLLLVCLRLLVLLLRSSQRNVKQHDYPSLETDH